MKFLQKHVLFAAISCIAFLWTVFKNYEEANSTELVIFSGYCAAVLLLQGAFLTALNYLKAPDWLTRIAAGVFTALNVYTLIFIHAGFFAALSAGLASLAVLALSAGFSALYFIKNSAFQKFASRFSLIMIVLIAVEFVVETTQLDSFRSLPKHFSTPAFTSKPNIYVITIDAMSPKVPLKQNAGLDISFGDVIAKNGGRVVPNAFVERISTKWSLNSFMAMDLDYFDSLKKQHVLIPNQVANPVYDILRENGYKIQFMYKSSYFGDDHGKLDFYGAAKVKGLCTHIEKPYAMMGYCLAPVQTAIKSLTGIEDREYPEYLFDRIKTVSKSGEPWFTMAHIYMPGHAKNSFNPYKESDWAEFRKEYAERSKTAMSYIGTLTDLIRENDPNAILITFGDHGPLTSRKLLGDPDEIRHYALSFDPQDLAADSPLTYKQIVQDRHAVMLGVFPKDFCKEGFRHNPYSTVRIMRDVFKCLSGGQDPLPASFQPDDDKWAPYSYE